MNELKRGLEEYEEMNSTGKVDETPKEKVAENKKGEVEFPSSNTENGKSKISLITKFKLWYNNLPKNKKILLWIGISTFLLIIIISLSLIFKLDSYLFPSSLVGKVTDGNDEAVQGVTICIDSICSTSEVNGSYVIGNLKYGEVNVSVEDPDYVGQEITYVLKRGRNELDIKVEPAGFGNIIGQLSEDFSDYSDLKIYFDDEEVEFDENGKFTVENIAVGDYILKVESVYVRDDDYEVSVKEGDNQLDTISFVEAGDVKGKIVDFLSLEDLVSATVIAPGVEKKTNENGIFRIQDLETDKELKIKVLKENYIEKELKVEVETGLNEIEDIQLVRKGKVVYVSNRLGNQNIYASNYDGSNEKMLSDNNGDSYSPYLAQDSKTVYFVSTREKIKNDNNLVPQVYSTSVEGGDINKISMTSYDDAVGNYLGTFNFESMKRAFVLSSWDSDSGNYELHFSNLDGTDSKKIYELDEGYIGSMQISKDGSFLVFNMWGTNEEENDPGLYYIDSSGNSTEQLYSTNSNSFYPVDISPNGKLVLVKVWDDDANRWDLWIIGMQDDTELRVTNTSSEEFQPRFTPDGNHISFYSNRDSRSDVYRIGIDGTGETKLTNDGMIDDYFYGDDGLLFYNSEKVMWVIDSENNSRAQEVTDSVLGTYYSSNYYCYGGCSL